MTGEPATLWHATAPPRAPSPPLTGKLEADLLVVGGGFLGLSTALHAAEAGLSVILLEAESIAFGATGRNAGFVVPNFAKVDPDAVVEKLGAERGKRLVSMAAESADLVFGLIQRFGIACDADQAGWIQPSHHDGALQAARERVRQWASLGRPVSFLDAQAVQALTGVKGWRGGWLDRSGGTVNPVALARGLARAAEGAGVRVFEQSPVERLERRGDEWRAVCAQGEVTARRVVLATNAHAGSLWPGLRQSFFPLRVFQIATAPLPSRVRERLLPEGQCVSDSRRNLFTFRFDAQNRLITGGMHVIGAGAQTRVPRTIHRRMARMLDLPDIPPIEYSWSGLASVTPDFLPRLLSLAPNLAAGFACNGRGIAMSIAAGRDIAIWSKGAAFEDLALPVRGMHGIPLHALLRHAPNALLPLSMLRDRRETGTGLQP